MADVTKGSSNQIDEVSSPDGPPTICEPVPGNTNADSQGLDSGDEGIPTVALPKISVRPWSFLCHRINDLGSSDAASSSSKDTPSTGFVSNPPRPWMPMIIDSDDEFTAELSSTPSKAEAKSKGFVLNPSRLSNAFAKVGAEEEWLDGKSLQSEVTSTPSKAEESAISSTPKSAVSFVPLDGEPSAPLGGEPSAPPAPPTLPQASSTTTPSFGFVFGQNIHEKVVESAISSTPKSAVSFVPLDGEPSAPLGGEPSAPPAPPTLPQASSTTTPSFGFVFGQNIHEKVVEATTPAETATVSESTSSQEEAEEVTTKGTAASEMLFSAHAKKEEDKGEKASDSGGKTLDEAAREYEEARATKRKFEEVQVITGEEEESNVLQMNCKLFSWSSSTWVERGRGTLRVNDSPSNTTHHRLIIRSAGSLRVVLNTNIWSGMTVDRASNKSMRITAMDSQQEVKVFLITASPREMDQLQKCLEWRVNNLKKNEPVSHKKVKDDDEPLPPPLDDEFYTF